MKSNSIFCAASLLMVSSMAISAPHWTHDEQAEWGAIDDAVTSIPLKYPYADVDSVSISLPLIWRVKSMQKN